MWEHRTQPPSEEEWSPKLPPHLEDAADLSQLRQHALRMEKAAAEGVEVSEHKEVGQIIREFAEGYKQNCAIM